MGKLQEVGKYGGKALRVINLGNGERLLPGKLIEPEVAAEWPISNRIALEKENRVEWFSEPPPWVTGKKEEKQAAKADKKVPAKNTSTSKPKRKASPKKSKKENN